MNDKVFRRGRYDRCRAAVLEKLLPWERVAETVAATVLDRASRGYTKDPAASREARHRQTLDWSSCSHEYRGPSRCTTEPRRAPKHPALLLISGSGHAILSRVWAHASGQGFSEEDLGGVDADCLYQPHIIRDRPIYVDLRRSNCYEQRRLIATRWQTQQKLSRSQRCSVPAQRSTFEFMRFCPMRGAPH
ncbi:hypothetical protein HaLaN_30394 [Haematococcus lacustris]|uniref:Uncharacterized protein n=1 Tax=Haematococcus lacustris TaxID=44745 RepID=A0A6A0AH47_HAELA|nr:hypothetical protein HaLaN_30394 [Haematococcus lacustris]